MIESSKRLTAVFHMTPAVHCVGDIGCDHGYISHALLKTNRAEKVIATDISAPSLNKAATLLSGAFCGRFETRLGDGFAPIAEGEIQGAIIMGMGGQLIADILARGKDVVNSLDWCIVQPMQGAEDLFDYLNRSGFELMEADLVEERGKFYPLMKIAAGGKFYSLRRLSRHGGKRKGPPRRRGPRRGSERQRGFNRQGEKGRGKVGGIH